MEERAVSAVPVLFLLVDRWLQLSPKEHLDVDHGPREVLTMTYMKIMPCWAGTLHYTGTASAESTHGPSSSSLPVSQFPRFGLPKVACL